MPNVTGENLTFNIDSIADNQILVYDAAQGVFLAQNSLAADANAAVTGASNTGASGIGVFSAKDGDQLKFKKFVGSGATTITEASNVITVSTTAYSLPTTLQTTATNANSFVYRGRNFGDNANIDAYAGVYNDANYPIHSQSKGSDAKTRFIIGSSDQTDVELKSAHGLILSTSTADGHIEVRSANSTVFYAGSSSSTTPALKINANRSLTVSNVFTLPTSDGTTGQVLKTDGSGSLSWTSVSLSGVSPSELTANLANYIPKNASSTPGTTQAYDIGSSSKVYLNIYASNFKGTADYALRIGTSGTNLDYTTLANMSNKTLNLSDLASKSTARTNLSVYSKAQVDANIASAQLQNSISQVNVVGSANTINAATATSAIRFEGGDGISLNQYTANSTIQISKSDAITGTFKNLVFDGTYVVAETNSDTMTFTSGANISFTPNAGTDSVVIDATLNDASIDKYTKSQVNTYISANVDALRFYKTVTGDTGSTSASTKDDTFNVIGGSGITTAVTGDTVTITNSNQPQDSFKNVVVAGQDVIVAENTSDSLTFEAGSGITLTTDTSLDKVIITNSAGGGGGGATEAFKTVSVTGGNSVVATGTGETLTFTAGANATITADNASNTITIDATASGGSKGATGATGSAGSNGATGSKGEVGAGGSTGATGSAGAAGSTGPAGAAGGAGDKGAQGAQGTAGTTGSVGPAGSTGSEGPTGPAGSTGTTGDKGAVGPQGTTGTTGSAGAAGAKGEVGSTGGAGPTGPNGSTGPAGSNGSNGSNGDKGATGADSTVVGPNGPTGPQGTTGDKGAQGATGADSTVVGPTGSAGGTGPAGDKGAQGSQGAQGLQGTAGTTGSNGSDGSTGSKGEIGSQGPTGPQGSQGTTGNAGGTGPAGATGPLGPQGNVGSNGPTGDKGQKGELGGPTGPTGDKGATGSIGPQGAQGSTGSNGSDGAQGPSGDKGQKGDNSTVAGPTGSAGSNGSAGAAGDKGDKGEGGGGSSEVFKTIAVSGQSSVVADAATDTLTLVGGSGMTITTDAGTDTVTFVSSGGGGSTRPGTYERLKLNYSTSGTLTSISDSTAGINATTVTSAAGAEIEVQFTGFSYPPIAVMAHGYDYSNHKYVMNGVAGDWTVRTVDGGGSIGSPTAFGSFSTVANVDLKVTEAITGASRSFGTSTHAWITFVMAE